MIMIQEIWALSQLKNICPPCPDARATRTNPLRAMFSTQVQRNMKISNLKEIGSAEKETACLKAGPY